MIKTMLGNVEANFNGHYVIENSGLCLNDEELEKIELPRLTGKEREFYDKIDDCSIPDDCIPLYALLIVYDWHNAGMIDLYELEHLIVAIVKGGYNH